MASNFGVVTFDDAGPIKTWARLAAVAAHNNRAHPEPHCDPAAPQPVHLCGGRDLVAEVKARLVAHGIDPRTLRSNVNIAFEAVLTASRPFFTDGTYEEAMRRTGRWIGQACNFASKMWGEHRIVSMVLHLDETTPHIHVVLLPLNQKDYTRWPERKGAWTLDSRVICGPGEYQRVHDAYADAMAPLGLVRGVSQSRAKYRPYSAELAELEEMKARAAAARVEAEKAAANARQQASDNAAKWAEERDRLERLRLELDVRAGTIKEAEALVVRQKTSLRMAALRMEARERQVEAAVGKVREDRKVAHVERCEAHRRLGDLRRSIENLAVVSVRASALQSEIYKVPRAEQPACIRAVMRKIDDFDIASVLVKVSDEDREALPVHVQRRLKTLLGESR